MPPIIVSQTPLVCATAHKVEYVSAQIGWIEPRKIGNSLRDRAAAMKTDKQVQQDVLDELKWEPSVNAARIGVEVKDGIVTLAGQVASYAEKWHVEHSAQRVAGVKALTIAIEVILPGTSERKDADIAAAAERALQWVANLPPDSIGIMVEGGWVTLSGDVEWEYQRQAAAEAVRSLTGVAGVSDYIAIRPSVALSAVKADIEAALKRRAHTDAQNISVEVRGTEVRLSGTVHSWSERELAKHSAWGTPGVWKVVDNISIV